MQNTYRLEVGGVIRQALAMYPTALLPAIPLACLASLPSLLGAYDVLEPSDSRRGTLFSAACVAWMLATVIHIVDQRLRGRTTSILGSLWFGAKAIPRTAIVASLFWMTSSFGMLLFVVPGVLVLTKYFIAVPVAVLETRWYPAFYRSAALTRGNLFPVLAVAAVWLAVTVTPIVVLRIYEDEGPDALPPWTSAAMLAVVAPFVAVLPAVCYRQLRIGREGIDAERVAAVFQ